MNDHVEELRALAARENPVEIAGYGRESTHKGYLSWILDSRRNPEAPRFLKALCEHAKGEDSPKHSLCSMDPPKKCRCYWEQKLARRTKVDLLVKAGWKDLEYAIPIELKADSGESGDMQFEKLSAPEVFEGTQIADRLVLCLGAVSVRWLSPEKFKRLGPDEILAAASACGNRNKQFFSDWLASVLAERKRHLAALEAYGAVQAEEVDHWSLGYRSRDHLLFYVLDALGEKLTKKIPSSCWALYSGGHNTVLNLEIDGEWSRTRKIRGNLFFEFNNESFILKLRNGEWGHEDKGRGRKNDPAKLKKFLFSVREEVIANSPEEAPIAEPVSNKGYENTWLGVVKWRFDIARQDEVVEAVAKILNQCGPAGCLAPFVH